MSILKEPPYPRSGPGEVLNVSGSWGRNAELLRFVLLSEGKKPVSKFLSHGLFENGSIVADLLALCGCLLKGCCRHFFCCSIDFQFS